MEPIVGVYLTSLLGAGAFYVAGYVLGQRGVVLPLLGLDAPSKPSPPPATVPSAVEATPAGDRPTPAVVTPLASDLLELESTRAELEAVRARADGAARWARATEKVAAKLERQSELLRSELRREIIAREAAVTRAEELEERLARASADASRLRHDVSVLEREATKLGGRSRTSLAAPGAPPSSPKTTRAGDETGHAPLREEIARLTAENRDLRVRALGSMPPKRPSRDAVPELDLDVYRDLVERLGTIAGLEGAAIGDEVGALLLGSGPLAEGLAAFGAYIRDASSRAERLLPLESVEEIDVLDRGGVLLSTRALPQGSPDVCLVLLATSEASLVAAKEVVAETLRSGD